MLLTTNAYLLLGTNMGNRIAQLGRARDEIIQEIGALRRISSIFETDAWGNEDQPLFLNQVVLVATSLPPRDLLRNINDIETRMDRVRLNKWESRPIDIDILYYADEIIDEADLQIPHPYLPDRRFALVPLAEIAPHHVHPISKKTSTELLIQTSDQLAVRPFNPDTYERHKL